MEARVITGAMFCTLDWLGYVVRKEDDQVRKKALEDSRRHRQSTYVKEQKQDDDDDEDLKALNGVRSRRTTVEGRTEWNGNLRKAKVLH